MPDRKTDPTELHHMTGQVPYHVEQNILLLRDALDQARALNQALVARLDAQPPILTLDEIQRALSPTGSNPLPSAALLNTNPPPTNPAPPPGPTDNIPDYLSVVQSTATTLGISGASTDEEMFRFIQTVVQNINLTGTVPSGIVCGLCLAPVLGSNVFTCQGITYRYGRLCFSNGHLFDVLIDADPGGARTPQWADNGFNTSLYSVATDPTSPC